MPLFFFFRFANFKVGKINFKVGKINFKVGKINFLKLVKSTLKLEKSTLKNLFTVHGACWLCLVYVDYRST